MNSIGYTGGRWTNLGSRNRLAGAIVIAFVLVAVAAEPAPEVHFSPTGGIQHRLLRAINHGKATIDLAVFDLTAGELAGALLTARARGIVVRVVADSRQAQGKHSEIPVLIGRGVKVRLLPEPRRGLMHHKFASFDGKLVVTGSVVQRFQAYFGQLVHGVPARLLGSRP